MATLASASGYGTFPVWQFGGLPRRALPVDQTFGRSIDITVGPASTRIDLNNQVINAGITPGGGASAVINLFERTVVIAQEETGRCCTPK